jgi:hypothetical protein
MKRILALFLIFASTLAGIIDKEIGFEFNKRVGGAD